MLKNKSFQLPFFAACCKSSFREINCFQMHRTPYEWLKCKKCEIFIKLECDQHFRNIFTTSTAINKHGGSSEVVYYYICTLMVLIVLAIHRIYHQSQNF